MSTTSLRSLIRRSLFVITVFNAVSALAGGIGILATGGLGMPASFLATGPFRTFTGPGLILLIVIGGTQTLAAVLLLLRRDPALVAAAVAGFGMQIWIYGEVSLIGGSAWLQVLYFSTGTLQLIFVLGLTGIVSWLPREPGTSPSDQRRDQGPRRWRSGDPIRSRQP